MFKWHIYSNGWFQGYAKNKNSAIRTLYALAKENAGVIPFDQFEKRLKSKTTLEICHVFGGRFSAEFKEVD